MCDRKCVIGNDIAVIKHNQNPKYLSYVFSTTFCKDQIKKYLQKGAIIIHLHIPKIKKIQIPLPPRHIQDQIADLLDLWTNMKTELERELECRQKQYQHYKELLLTSGKDKWEIKSLGEIALGIYSGDEITKAQLGTGDYPAIKNEDINKFNIHFYKCINEVDENLIKNKKYCEHGNLLVSLMGNRVAGKACVYLGKEKAIVGNHIAVLKHKENPKYISYMLSTNFCRNQIKKQFQKGAIIHLYIPKLKKIQIPLPPLEEQERIVAILDQFYELCGDVEKGIPWLINAIEEQYKYYKEEILVCKDS